MTEKPDQPNQPTNPEPKPDRPAQPARAKAEPEQPTKPQHDKPRSKRRNRRRRHIVRVTPVGRWRGRLILLLILAALVFTGYFIAERIRTGDTPRTIAQSVVSSALGLRVEIGSVELAWSGRTIVRDIIVRLPLDDAPLIEIDRVNATHWHIALIGILRDPGLSHLELEGVRVLLERDHAGQWNLIEALNRITAATAGDGTTNAPIPSLPQLRAESVTVQLRDAGQDLGQLNARLTGDPESALGYAFQLEEPAIGTMDGRIAVGGNWSHRINFQLQSLGPLEQLLRALLPDIEHTALDQLAANATGRWTGQVTPTGLTGSATIDTAHATAAGRTVEARGGAALTLSNNTLSLEPRRMRVWSEGLGEAELLGGTLRLIEGRIEFDRLRARSLGITADVDGTWRIAREAGEFSLAWSGRDAGPIAAHHGRAEFQLVASEAGRTTVRGTTDATVEIGRNRLRAEVDLDATALLPDRAAGGLRFRRLSWSGPDETPIELAGFEARVALAEGIARLTRLRIPGADLERVRAEYAIDDNAWHIDIATADWLVPRFQELGAVTLAVRARGQAARAEEWSLALRNAWALVDASGSYDPYRPEPLRATTQLAVRLAETTDNTTAVPPLLTGGVNAQLDLAGTLDPVALTGSGALTLTDLMLRGEPLDPLTVNGIGTVNPEGIAFASDEFALLGGSAQLLGSVTPDATVGVRVNASRIVFDELSEAVGVGTRLGGTMSVDLQLDIPEGNAGRATIVGDWNARDLRLDPIAIDLAAGRIHADRREARLEDITLERHDGRIMGRIAYDLITEAGLTLAFRAGKWPIEYQSLAAILDGSLEGSIDLASRTADLTVQGTAETRHNDDTLAKASIDAAVHEQTLTINACTLESTSGNITATGAVPINDWTRTTLNADIDTLDLNAIAGRFVSDDLAELLAEYSGLAQATLTIAPNTGPEAFGPLGIRLNGQFLDGKFRQVAINDFDVRVAAGPQRIVLERALLNIADGTIEAWGTSTMHAAERFVRLNAAIKRLDLDQLARSADPAMGAVPGRVSGSVVAGGYLQAPHRLFGESAMLIEESDLANVGPIAMIYNALNIGTASREPRGRGTASIRLEGEALEVTRFEYFNRGVDVFATLRLDRVMALMDSPVTGYAGGSVRPLRDLELPFAATVDRMLTTAQSDAVSVIIGGTLADYTVRIVPFSEAFGGLSRMLGTNQQPAER